MKLKFTIFLMCYLSLQALKAQIKEVEVNSLVIGKSVVIQSDILDENRLLNICLPSSYNSDSLKSYPVIYLLDGGMEEDLLHIAGLVQFGSMPWIDYWPEAIVVGIANVDRRRDFTFPTTIQDDVVDFPTSGKSDSFIRFIKNEVISYINYSYRSDSVSTIIGQSLGGLLATQILIEEPDLFTNYIIVSPSLWWNNQSLLQIPVNHSSNAKAYIAVGKEGSIMETDARSLAEKLKEYHNVRFQYFPQFVHGDILHQAASDGLKFIFEDSEK